MKLAEAGVIRYGAARIEMWHNPWEDYYGDGYQLAQSLITIGSGGLLGVGLGRGRQKFLYLPEQYNDFIFSVICEELGLIGACVIMLIFSMLILRGFWIALHARDPPLLKLRRHGAVFAAGGDGHRAERIATDTGGTGGIKAQDLTTFRILLQENYYSYQNIEVGPPRRFQGAAE